MFTKNRKIKKLWGALAFVAFFAAFTAIAMLLWNALIPTIFGLTTISFWQAAGLMILARLFFGGMGGHRFKKRHGDHHHPGFGPFRDKAFRDKFKGMSREEKRDYIRDQMSKSTVYWDEYFDSQESAQADK